MFEVLCEFYPIRSLYYMRSPTSPFAIEFETPYDGGDVNNIINCVAK